MKNPQKYVGTNVPIYRSSWEWSFMQMCDINEHVTHWSSEPLRIPYVNPVNGQRSVYVPDFLIEFFDSKKKRHVELVEVKPKKQAYLKYAKSKHDKLMLVINQAKWQAATKYANRQGIKFRVITEDDIFFNT